MFGAPRPAWQSRGWMSFTVAAGAHLKLGGAATVPTAYLSLSTFLAAGIPQNADKSAFAERQIEGETTGHTIKHIVYEIVSGGTPANAAAARIATDGSVPTATLGKKRVIADERSIENSRGEIFRFDLFNNTDGNMVVEVEVYE